MAEDTQQGDAMTSSHSELPLFARNAINLASPRLGAEVLSATDDFFADKSRMLADAPAVFDPDKYDANGKYMDGWESKRRRQGGHDSCIVRLGARGVVKGVDIDTSHFTGNCPPAASLEACVAAGDPGDTTQWTEILPAVSLRASAHHFHAVTSGEILHAVAPKATQILLNTAFRMFPDSSAAKGKKGEAAKEVELSPEQIAFAQITQGIHW